MRELAHRFLDWYEEHAAPVTYKRLRNLIRRLIAHKESRGIRWVSEMTAAAIDDYYATAKKDWGRGLNGGNHHLRALKQMLKWGYEEYLCDMPVRRFPKMRTQPPKTRVLSDDDLAKILPRLPADFRDMVVFGLLTGLRPIELRQLQFQDVGKSSKGEYHVRLEQHKTSASSKEPHPRDVPLCEEAIEIYERQRQAHPDSTYVFLDGDGQLYNKDSFRKRLQRWCKRAGIEPKPPYGLRHTFAVNSAGNGTNESVLQCIMGHTQITTTARYTMNNQPYHRAAVNAVADHLRKVLGQESGKNCS